MLLMQLQLTLTMFLLKILCNLLDFWKCCFNNFRNALPIFISTLRDKGRLNQIILHLCSFLLVLLLVFVFSMKTTVSLNPLFSVLQNMMALPGVAFWKISFLDDRSNSHLLIDLGNFHKIVFGWLESLLMYTGWLSGFLCFYINLKKNYQILKTISC